VDSNIKRSIILDNYQEPKNRGIPVDDGYVKINSNSVSCIDNIDIYVKVIDNIIKDIKYEGEACVIAISSTSILSDMIIGKSLDEARIIIRDYFNMIEEKEYDDKLLGEACVYDDIYKQPARKACATLFVRGMSKFLDKE